MYSFANPQVVIGSPDLKANHSITQIVEVMDEVDKYKRAIKVRGNEIKACNVRGSKAEGLSRFEYYDKLR